MDLSAAFVSTMRYHDPSTRAAGTPGTEASVGCVNGTAPQPSNSIVPAQMGAPSRGLLAPWLACQPANRGTKTAPSSQRRSDNAPFMAIGAYQHPISVGTLLISLGGPAFAASDVRAVEIGSLHLPALPISDGNARHVLALAVQRRAWTPTRVNAAQPRPVVCCTRPCADAPAVWCRRRRPTGRLA